MTTATATKDPELVEQEVSATLPTLGWGQVDTQVATAQRYPRSITTFIRRATEMATLTPEIAASCIYALPRGKKTIEGPSARLAEIVAHAWGNLRVQAGATDHDARYITGRGEAWDVESNVAIGFEVRRRITKADGTRYDDDMITVTGNAAASIALRNAVFKVVPSSFWKPIYLKCRQVVAGDAQTFASRRDAMLKAFMVMGVTSERLCAAIGVKGIPDVSLDHMVTLTGVYNALRDGEMTIEEAFPEPGQVVTAPAGWQALLQELPEAQASALAVAFTATGLSSAERVVLLRKYVENPDGLLAALKAQADKKAQPPTQSVPAAKPPASDQAADASSQEVSPMGSASAASVPPALSASGKDASQSKGKQPSKFEF